ncbi:ABA-responsive element binding protein 3 isoform 3 [Hibiscus syriacus]|uniref:ABA-responsive element binding protein 3 isoform 3 n=1 Tax=Hibiscus syriacus TaxID=106335 RepID=A0A6A2WU62_HIBSY|nr:ABA-responsive element binding protein 3 isoform 3 [Hibiscus syriacus]
MVFSPTSGYLPLVKALSGKTVDQVWKEIQGKKKRYDNEMDHQQGEATLGETTLEDFLVQAGLFVAEMALAPTMELDSTTQRFLHRIRSSPTTSIAMLSDRPMMGRKIDAQDALEKKLKRKVKNMEFDVGSSTPHQIGLSLTRSIGTLSDPPMTGPKRDPQDELEKRLRRKMKNRESAARSRARQQASLSTYFWLICTCKLLFH